MERDAFSRCHPAVNFIFFLGVLGFGMVILHPAYLCVSVLCALSYHLALYGIRGLKRLLALLPVLLAVALLNPLLNTTGQTVLLMLFGRPYTLEALVYGCVLAGMFLNVALWFSCFGAVMTGDKITSLFGTLAPSLSLLLVMIFRLVPELLRKGRQILGARRAIGKGSADLDRAEAATMLGCLTGLALEGGVVMADSMRSRGYGCARRSSFRIYTMTGRDLAVLAVQCVLIAGLIITLARGGAAAAFTPRWQVASPGAGLLLYWLYCLIPTAFYVKEAITWHFLRSGI